MVVVPTREVGAAPSGSANDALINIALSLTVGSRWRSAPAFQVEEAGGFAAWASNSPGSVAKRAAPPEPERKSRLFMVILLGPVMTGCLTHISTLEPFRYRRLQALTMTVRTPLLAKVGRFVSVFHECSANSGRCRC